MVGLAWQVAAGSVVPPGFRIPAGEVSHASSEASTCHSRSYASPPWGIMRSVKVLGWVTC
jgi:hypothetical protein